MEYNRLIQIGNEIESTEKPILRNLTVLQIVRACNSEK